MSLETLVDLLQSHQKALIIDKSLSSSINYLIPFSKLKSQCNITQVYWFDNPLTTIPQVNNITFLIRSNLSNLEILKNRVDELNIHHGLKLDLIITDDYAKSFKHQLSNKGILGDLNSVHNWKLFLFDPNDNVFNLNLKDEFKSLYLFKTTNIPFKLASLLNNHLHENNNNNTQITHILGKGLNSSKFINIFKNLQNESINNLSILDKQKELKIHDGLYGKNSNNSGKQCDLIVLERNLDFLSVLLSQLTFSGLIDEVYDIDNNTIKLSTNYTVFLNSDKNSLYNLIKNLNFGIACDYLNLQAKELQKQYDSFQQNSNDLNKVKNFVEELGKLENLKKQVSELTKISEDVLVKIGAENNINNDNNDNNDNDTNSSKFNELLEFQQDILLRNLSYSNIINKLTDSISTQDFTINDILRLICITSIVFNGLKEKDYNSLQTDIIEFHGIRYLLLLQNFLKIGIISISGDLSIIKNFSHLNSKFQLIPNEEQDDQLSLNNPLEMKKNPNFAYRGYVPLLTRILEQTYLQHEPGTKRSSWKDLELNSFILGKTIDEELSHTNSLNNNGLGGALQKNGTTYIVMIGGLTYSELATIKYIEGEFKRKFGIAKKFIIITDSFINAGDLIQSCV